jgi:hypothetical protein
MAKICGLGEKMRELLKSNIYDVDETIAIVGACLNKMQPQGFEKIKANFKNIYTICLEEFHINMAITKIASMIRTGKIKKLVFATVDKSPHCVQMHYIRCELEKMMELKNIDIINYVVVDNELIEIKTDIISLSKNLAELREM